MVVSCLVLDLVVPAKSSRILALHEHVLSFYFTYVMCAAFCFTCVMCAVIFSVEMHMWLYDNRRRNASTSRVHQVLLTLAIWTFHRAMNLNCRKLLLLSVPSLLPLTPAIRHSSCTKVVSVSYWHVVFHQNC